MADMVIKVCGTGGNIFRGLGLEGRTIRTTSPNEKTRPMNVVTRTNIPQSIQAALQYHRAGRVPEAEEILGKVLEIQPGNPDALYFLGIMALQGGKHAAAVEFLDRASRAKVANPAFYHSIGEAFRSLNMLDEALACYQKALSIKSNLPETHNSMGCVYRRQGKLDKAIASCRKAVSLKPSFAEGHSSMGNAFLDQGRYDEALACYRRAIALRRDFAEAHNSLGVVLAKLGQADQAAAAYQQALALNPRYVEAQTNLGNLHRDQGKLDDAVACYQAALSLTPNLAELHNNLGVALARQGRLDEALACYERAVALRPDYAEAYNNLGNAYRGRHEPEQAIVAYEKALSLKPGLAAAHSGLGNVYEDQGRHDDAIACHERAIALQPDYFEGLFNLAAILDTQGRLDEAIAYFLQAVVIRPDDAGIQHRLGNALFGQGRFNESVVHYRRAVELRPEDGGCRLNLVHALQQLCEWGDLDSNVELVRKAVLETQPADAVLLSPFSFLMLPGATAEEQRRCAETWARRKYRSAVVGGAEPGFDFRRPGAEKIHVGYLSSDFHHHATAHLMAQVFELHDRNRFSITAYSYGPDDGSAMRKRLERAFDRFVELGGQPDEAAATMIREDRVDILVDLKGYTQGSRASILALRPAPVQVNYLGYPGTMGASFVDYLIADGFIIPPEHEKHYTETVMRLPDCYQPNDRMRALPEAPSRIACGLPEEGLVFCSFNQTYKITPAMFDVWCRLLKAVPGSVMWLLASNPGAEPNLKREAETRGVAANRIVMAPLVRPEEHLARMQCADLFLDTAPCNAHTTCSDALWMGLPVITWSGATFPSRVAGSLLTAMGAPELIARSLEDYYALAYDLASDKAKRDDIRSKLVANRYTAPLFDSERLTRNLEQAYLEMWRRWQGEASSIG